VEGAVFSLLGLLIAFTFSGAASRFDSRRQLTTEEANDIGTAYLRLDLLPNPAQAALRDMLRQYLDSRIETYRKLPDMEAAKAELARSLKLQGEIWTATVAACRDSGPTPAHVLLLPALNQMFDIVTTRIESTRIHPPVIIFVMLGVLTLAASFLAGYDMASGKGGSQNDCVDAKLVGVTSATVCQTVDKSGNCTKEQKITPKKVGFWYANSKGTAGKWIVNTAYPSVNANCS